MEGESASRRGVAALVVGLAGPLTFLTVFYALGGGRVDVPDSEGLDSLVEVMAQAMVLSALAAVALGFAAIATMVAFVLTRARWALAGWLLSVVLFPMWAGVMDHVSGVPLVGYCFALGALPAAVRLALPTRPRRIPQPVTAVLSDP